MNVFQQQQFPHPIFQVQIDPAGHALGVELRDQASQTVFFGLLNLETGSWLSSGEAFPWWTGLSRVFQGYLVLEDFAEKTLPVRQGVQVISADGSSLWENPSCNLVGPSLQGPLIRDEQGQMVLLLIDGAGKVQRKELDLEEWKGLETEYSNWENTHLHFPLPGNPTSSEWQDWLEAAPAAQTPFPMLDLADWKLGTWHHSSEQGYVLLLGAEHVSGQSHQWVLEENMAGMHPEPFFTFAERVICTLGRQVLAWSIPLRQWQVKS